MDITVTLRGVSKTFRRGQVRTEALRDVSLDVPSGIMLVVAGPSGSGKTTLLNIIGGMDRPSTGTVVVEGQKLGDLDEHGLALYRGRSVGFVFQGNNLISGLSALENVEMPLVLAGMDSRKRRDLALEMLDRVGLEGHSDALPSELSGGEQQRVAIARALVHGPSLLLADEPTGNLDSQTAQDIIKLMWNLTIPAGNTAIIATHDPEIISHASVALKLHDGRPTLLRI